MIWIPWSAWSISRSIDSRALQHRLKWVAIVATLLGIGFYVPVLFQSDLVQPAIEAGRIHYQVDTAWHNFVNTEPIGQLVYWGFIVLPLVAVNDKAVKLFGVLIFCLLYTSPSPRDATLSRMPSSA